MADKLKYKRVLVKLSGEGLARPGAGGIDPQAVAATADELVGVAAAGAQTAVVIGAGNFIRGRDLAAEADIRRATGDYMGMLATVVNALALRDAVENRDVPACLMSAIPMPAVCEQFNSRRARRCLDQGRVVIFAGGTGCPFFTTDTAASLRAAEIGAEALVKATKVDGVFDSDPEKNASAAKYERLTYEEVLADRLGVMDLTAVSMCMDNRIPIIVLQLTKPGNLAAAVRGRAVGSIIGPAT